MMNTQELLDLKEEITEAHEKLSNLKGRRDTLTEQLQNQFGVKTLAAAEKKVKALEKEIAEWQDKINIAADELEKKVYGQDTGTQE